MQDLRRQDTTLVMDFDMYSGGVTGGRGHQVWEARCGSGDGYVQLHQEWWILWWYAKVGVWLIWQQGVVDSAAMMALQGGVATNGHNGDNYGGEGMGRGEKKGMDREREMWG